MAGAEVRALTLPIDTDGPAGVLLARTVTDGQGRYEIRVPAGSITIDVVFQGPLPCSQPVTVVAGRTVRLDITCDTGIR